MCHPLGPGVSDLRWLPGGAIAGTTKSGALVVLGPGRVQRTLRGTWGGDNVPDRDYPRYGKLLASGRLDLGPLMSKSYGLADVNAALDDLERGAAVRPLLEIGAQASGLASRSLRSSSPGC